jgi:hypothetical protein
MPWTSPVNSEILAIHAALVPTSDGMGEIIYFGGDQHNPAFITPSRVDATRRLNLSSMTISYVRSPSYDLFCAGQCLLPDGRLLVAGGTAYFPGGIPPGGDPHGHGGLGHFPGHRYAGIYNGATHDFIDVSPMRPNPAQAAADEGGGRWYPTLVTLANGDVLAMAGHPSTTDERHNNTTPERFRPVLNSWTGLQRFGADLAGPDLYPRLHVLRSGEVFCSSRMSGSGQCVAYNAFTGNWRDLCPLPPGEYHGFTYSSVLLPLLPEDNYRPRVFLCGANIARRIALDPPEANWTQAGDRTGSAATKRRENCCTVILPTGKVLVVGGVNGDDDTVNDDAFGVREPELYDPGIDWQDGNDGRFGRYTGTNGTWQTLNDQAAVTRNYHSTALLLPDGRVWTSGSSRGGLPGDPSTTGRLNYEIFTPPYPAGTRSRLTAAPGFAAYGQVFEIRSDLAAQIQRVALVRCGSVTHAFDSDQRYIALRFQRSGGNRIVCQAPPHGGIAPPGVYMLFIVDAQGRPCERARFIRIGGIAYLVTNRSQFAREEVSTLSPRTVPDALLLVLDGFLPGDLLLPAGPNLTFRWADNGQIVPGMHEVMLDTRSETGSFTPGLAQRFVIEYGVAFDNLDAFNTLPASNQRGILVTAELANGLTIAARLTLFRDAKPYMKDGDRPWLSIDVRVVQRPVGGVLAGIVQGDGANAGTDFIRDTLARFNSRPNDSDHPFERLATDENTSRLELSSHVNGQRVFNYAFARVRFRAPVGQNANDVRLFFRMMTTVGTSFNYNTATMYRRSGNGPTAIPQFGQINGRTVSVPYFAAARGGDNLAATDLLNVHSFSGQGANEVVHFFGCWLDFNQRDNLRQLLRGEHQCLVAELHYPPRPIEAGASPGDSDALSQRNLAIVASDNPGAVAGHIVQHTFELLPLRDSGGREAQTQQILQGAAFVERQPDHPITHEAPNHDAALEPNPAIIPPAAEVPLTHVTAQALAIASPPPFSELMIRWGNLPRDAVATLYFPDIDMEDWLQQAVQRPGQGAFELVDQHTVRCTVGEVTFLPVPVDVSNPLPGLLSIQMPSTVKAGQKYKITAHQIAGVLQFGRTGEILSSVRTLGSFELTIPVGNGVDLLVAEERKFAVLQWIAERIPVEEFSWRKVFERYLGQIADRVRAFGGDPDKVVPSPAGGKADQPKPDDTDDCQDDKPPIDDCQGDRHRHYGRIVALHYGCFGEFLGFDLDTCPGHRRYQAIGKGLEAIALRASEHGLCVTVQTHAQGRNRACGIILHY